MKLPSAVKLLRNGAGQGLERKFIRLPLTRELSPKVTEGESYNILLLSLKNNNQLGFSPSVTQSVPPPPSGGGSVVGQREAD